MKSLQELLACVAVTDANKKRRGYFQPSSGNACYIHDPQSSYINIFDIATSLARLPRFGCMYASEVDRPYTVAQHSVLVASLVSPENQLEALLHDATEAYLGDVISPLKRAVGAAYKDIEHAWALEIGERFRLGSRLGNLAEETTRADLTMLMSEKRRLKVEDPDGEVWGIGWTDDDCVPIPEIWSEVEARNLFLDRFMALFLEPWVRI